MKSYLLLLLSFPPILFWTSSCLQCAFRRPTKDAVLQEPQQVYAPPVTTQQSPSDDNKKLDERLFMHFVKILGNFSKILINPHDKINVTANAAEMVDGVVAVAHELINKSPLSQQQRGRLVRLLVAALVQNGALPIIGLSSSGS